MSRRTRFFGPSFRCAILAAAGFLAFLTGGCPPTGADGLVLGETVENPNAPNAPGSGGGDGSAGGGAGGDGAADDGGGASSPDAKLEVTPASLDFGTTLTELSLLVRNAGGGTLTYTVKSKVFWAKATPTSGTSTSEADAITVTVDRSALSPGSYAGTIEVAGAGQVKPVMVAMSVPAGPTAVSPPSLEATPSHLDFGLTYSTLTLALLNPSATPLKFDVVADAPWVSATPASGSAAIDSAVVTVIVDRGILGPGIQQATLTISTDQQITVYVPVTANGGTPTSVTKHAISGRVTRTNQLGGLEPVAGAVVSADGGGGAAVTDADGNYSVLVPAGWAGSVAPVAGAYGFTPRNRVYSNVSGPVASQDYKADPIQNFVPGFHANFADGTQGFYAGGLQFSEARLDATIQHLGNYRWELTVHTKGLGITSLWFPWEMETYTLNPDISDDVLFSTLFLGVAVKADSLQTWSWQGWIYPGVSFAPLTVIADGTRAKLVAATNWPPTAVYAMYSLKRQGLSYKAAVPPYSTRKYGALVVEVDGNAALGLHPWQIALDSYSAWLNGAMHAAGLYPIQFSPTTKHAHGWIQLGTMNYAKWELPQPQALWNTWKHKFPWVQCWGQMSNYAGDPILAQPPLLPGEEVGCCVGKREMHGRYASPSLPGFAAGVKSQGGAFGYYCRPRSFGGVDYGLLDDPTVIDGETNMQWLVKWIDMNRNLYGANAFYVDVIGRGYFGEPAVVIDLFKTHLPQDTIIEGIVDCYPTGGLIAGYINGQPMGGGPTKPLEKLGQGYTTTSVPRFGRCLLPDRVIFVGEANFDHMLWGPTNGYYVERQGFLLGAKFDVSNPGDSVAPIQGMNAALWYATEEWNRVGWWAREPLYRDRRGITSLPPDVDVRVFIDKNGVVLFACDNPLTKTGQSFLYNGKPINVPPSPLSIVEHSPY